VLISNLIYILYKPPKALPISVIKFDIQMPSRSWHSSIQLLGKVLDVSSNGFPQILSITPLMVDAGAAYTKA